MWWLFFLSCVEKDSELLAIKEYARQEKYELVEQRYLQILNEHGADRNVYLGLARLWEAREDPRAVAAYQRARILEHANYFFAWSGGLLGFLVLSFWFRFSFWIRCFGLLGAFVTTGIAFYDDPRDKGTVISAETSVFISPSLHRSVLFSLKKGAEIQILSKESGYFLIEYENKQGWIPQETILSWDPSDSFLTKE